MFVELDWKKIEGYWCSRTWEYIGVAWPFIVQDLAILNGIEIGVEYTSLCEQEVEIESCYGNGNGNDDIIRMIAGVQGFVKSLFKRRHIEYDHGSLFPGGI